MLVLCERVCVSFQLCTGMLGSGNMGDSGMRMWVRLGYDVLLVGVRSILWCPSMVGCGYCSGTGVAVSGMVWSLCCHGVVMEVVDVVCGDAGGVSWGVAVVGSRGWVRLFIIVVVSFVLSGVDRSLGSSAGAAHSSLSVAIVLSGVDRSLGNSAGTAHRSLSVVVVCWLVFVIGVSVRVESKRSLAIGRRGVSSRCGLDSHFVFVGGSACRPHRAVAGVS